MLNHGFVIYSATGPGSPTVGDLLSERSHHQGNRLAYTFLINGEEEKTELTYGDLNRRSCAIGAWL
jgi:acyl-CoA synthetase (AMP-forming)/AMP-acid ligase II